MENLRQTIEHDLGETLEGEFSTAVRLTSPDGETQIYKKNSSTVLLRGQVLYFTRRENPETGETVVVNMPVLTLRISSLNRVPVPGEKWTVQMPISPVAGATVYDWTFNCDRSSEDGCDIGFMRFYPQKLENSTAPVVSS